MRFQKLNIAVLSIHSCPVGALGTKDTGGMSVYIRELAKALGQQGHHVDIFTRYHDQKHPETMMLDENVRLLHLSAGDPEDQNKLSIYPHVKEYAFALEALRRKNHTSYDIIHSHYWLSGLVGKFLQSGWNIPHMIMFHTLGIIKNRLGVGKPDPDFRICNEKALVKYCSRIVAATPREKNDLVRLYNADPETIQVIPCGVNQELFTPVDRQAARKQLHFSEKEKIVLYVGRIEPLKGLDRVIRAVARLNDTLPVKLLIVGGDQHHTDEMQEVIGLSRRLKAEDSVKFAGRVEQSALPLYYSAADLLVVASLYESFGLVALEALSCGTPVVSTPVGGIRTILQPGQTGCLVSGDSVEAMGRCLMEVLNRPEYYQPRTAAIRESVSSFSWRNIGNAVVSEYRSLLENQHSIPSVDSTAEKRLSCGG